MVALGLAVRVVAVRPEGCRQVEARSRPEGTRLVERSRPGGMERGWGHGCWRQFLRGRNCRRRGHGTFVAIGHVNRSIVSCDDGRTGVGNRSDNDDIRCFTSAPDGGKAPTATTSMARVVALRSRRRAGFVGNWGWGDPGVIRRSADGVNWSVVDQGANFASMAVGPDGTLFAASRSGKVSRDDGRTWTSAGTANLMAAGQPVWNVRRGGAGGTGQGVYVVVADSNTAMVSSDLMTWRAPRTYPSVCGANIQWEGGVASGNGVLVILGGDGVACRSTDNGVTWTVHQTGGTVDSRLLWGMGSEFMTWGSVSNQRRVLRSPDGMTWTTTATSLRRNGAPVAGNGPRAVPRAARVARSWPSMVAGKPGNTSVCSHRSADGVTWTKSRRPGATSAATPSRTSSGVKAHDLQPVPKRRCLPSERPTSSGEMLELVSP